MQRYETKYGVLYNCDYNEVINDIQDNSVDLLLTDPPYGISKEIKITRGRNGMKFMVSSDISLYFGKWDDFENFDDCMNFTYRWLDAVNRVIREGGMFVTFFDKDKINFISRYLQEKYNYKLKGYFAYIKTNPVPQARKVKWMNAWECAVLLQKQGGKLTYNYQLGQQADYIQLPSCGGKERTAHPTQKPLKLIELFIKYWTNEGDVVLDPFSGSGTTAVACIKLDRRYIAIEKDEKYYEIVKNRIEEYSSQAMLF